MLRGIFCIKGTLSLLKQRQQASLRILLTVDLTS